MEKEKLWAGRKECRRRKSCGQEEEERECSIRKICGQEKVVIIRKESDPIGK